MVFIDKLFKMLDMPIRVRNIILRKAKRVRPYSNNVSQSDSQATFYEKTVNDINSSKRRFKRFRRIYNYREILEHLGYKDGKSYLHTRKINDFQQILKEPCIVNADRIGKPRKFYYRNIGWISPTTLRYIATGYDIRDRFDFSKITTIAEIGAGYGGQINVLNTLVPQRRYLVFDLPNVQILIQNFLQRGTTVEISFEKISSYKSEHVDLVISNYAFSELPKELQLEYLKKIMSKSTNGYLLMNSGKTNSTGRSVGKVSFEEIQTFLPTVEIHPEIPLTSADNYLLIWKDNTE